MRARTRACARTHTHTHTTPVRLIKLFICQPPSCRVSNSHNKQTISARLRSSPVGRFRLASVSPIPSDSFRFAARQQKPRSRPDGDRTKRPLVRGCSWQVSGVSGEDTREEKDHLTPERGDVLLDRLRSFIAARPDVVAHTMAPGHVINSCSRDGHVTSAYRQPGGGAT